MIYKAPKSEKESGRRYVRTSHKSTMHQMLSSKLVFLAVYFCIVLNIFLVVNNVRSFALNIEL